MKKLKFLTVILALVLALSTITALAVPAQYTYEAAKLVNAVTPDGKITGNEWDDAHELVINSDNEVFKKYGRFQGGSAPFDKNEVNLTYKVKWDDQNLYILEIRDDKKLATDAADALAPWTTDGTLFFLAPVNGSNPTPWESAFEPFWVPQGSDGKAHVSLRKFYDGTFSVADDNDAVGSWKYGATVAGTVATFELVIPFADIQKVDNLKFGEGSMFRFTPIVSNFDSAGEWDQLNFYDNFNDPDDSTNPGTGTTELPENWAALKLVAAFYAPPAANPVPEEVPAADNATVPAVAPVAAVSTPAPPQTGDCTVPLFILLSVCSAIVTTKFIKSKAH